MEKTKIRLGRFSLWPVNSQATLSLPVVITMYLFFAVRLSPDLMANNMLWMGTFALFLMVSIISIFNHGFAKNYSFIKWYIPFFVFSALSYYWTNYKTNVIEGLNIYIVTFASLSVMSLLIKNYEDFYIVLKVIMLALFTCFIDMLMNLNYSRLFSARLGLDNINSNWNANTLGLSLALFIVFSILLLKNKRLKQKKTVLVIDCIFVFCIILTGSRKALIFPALCISLMQMLEKRNRFWIRFFVVVLAVSIGYALIMNVPSLYDIVGYRFEGLLSGESTEGSYIGRSRMIELGLGWFTQSPLIGYGLNAFRAMSPWRVYAHNNFVELLVDIGLVGTVFYYSWALSFLMNRKRLRNSPLKNYMYSVLGGLLLMDMMMVSYNQLQMSFLIFSVLVLIDLSKRELFICIERGEGNNESCA